LYLGGAGLQSFMKRCRDFLPDIYVVARVLHALRRGPLPRSRLATLARVNYGRFQQYFQFLVERGYVVDGEVVVLTPRGAEVAAELGRLLSYVLGEENPLKEDGNKAPAGDRNLFKSLSRGSHEQGCIGSVDYPHSGGWALLPIHSPAETSRGGDRDAVCSDAADIPADHIGAAGWNSHEPACYGDVYHATAHRHADTAFVWG